MIKVLEASYRSERQIELLFSDGKRSVFDMGAYLADHEGTLLLPLKDESYLKRFFIDAGALCWPNGLELSPARLYGLCGLNTEAA